MFPLWALMIQRPSPYTSVQMPRGLEGSNIPQFTVAACVRVRPFPHELSAPGAMLLESRFLLDFPTLAGAIFPHNVPSVDIFSLTTWWLIAIEYCCFDITIEQV